MSLDRQSSRASKGSGGAVAGPSTSNIIGAASQPTRRSLPRDHQANCSRKIKSSSFREYDRNIDESFTKGSHSRKGSRGEEMAKSSSAGKGSGSVFEDITEIEHQASSASQIERYEDELSEDDSSCCCSDALLDDIDALVVNSDVLGSSVVNSTNTLENYSALQKLAKLQEDALLLSSSLERNDPSFHAYNRGEINTGSSWYHGTIPKSSKFHDKTQDSSGYPERSPKSSKYHASIEFPSFPESSGSLDSRIYQISPDNHRKVLSYQPGAAGSLLR